MANQLGEYDGEELQEDSLLAQEKQKDKKKENDKNAEKETILNCKIEGKDIILEHKNLTSSELLI